MKKLKALSIFIFIFGAFCLVLAGLQLSTLEQMLEPDNAIGYFISLGLIIGLWLYLTRDQTKHLLRRPMHVISRS